MRLVIYFFNPHNLYKKFIEISEVIKDRGFDFAALKYSLSPTSNLGGRLDWINENSLNKNIKETIKKLEINDFTKPIVVPGGFLILQINEIKNTKIEVNIENELKKLVLEMSQGETSKSQVLNKHKELFQSINQTDSNIDEQFNQSLLINNSKLN